MREFNISRSAVEHLIDEWIFKDRDRQILKRRLLDGICYDQLAEEFSLSVRQVKNIVYRCEDRLFKHM
jgi:DNA-directed RNA polymerase specialized sigma24 family protein